MKWFFILFIIVSVDCHTNVTEPPGNIRSTNPCSDQNHLFMAPGVLTAGGNSRACISRFYPEGPARMLLTLITEDKQITTASRELPPGDGGCADISVPQLPNTKAELVVNLRYPEAKCIWEHRIGVRISSGRVVVLHTERARYRPGDTLRVRAFAFKADLGPVHGVIDEIWLEGPRGAWDGARAAQWTRVRTRLGIAQVQHDLDELAPAGKWTVRARLADGSQGSAVFSVGNYELPPFQLSVRHAPKVLKTSERLVWTVCVRYPWTEAVEGMLVIRLRGAGGSITNASTGIRTAVRLRAPRACHRHAAASRRIGLDGSNPPNVVVADFSFQEEGTRIWQNTTVISQVVDKPISLEFLTKHRAVISPGLPYKLKVKATRWDDKPASNERIRLCRSPATHASDNANVSSDSTCHDAITDAKGVARAMFTAGDDATAFYRFQATLSNDTTTSAPPLFLPVQRSGSVHAALGPLRGDPRETRTFVPLYLSVNPAMAITVHFVVITRGGVIYRWGATTQCPVANSADQIQPTNRNSRCHNNLANFDANPAQFSANTAEFDANMANASDSLLDRHLPRVMLPIKVSHQMCPDSHLIAYFYYNGELVTANKHLEMDECFVNKVEATWLSRQALPGSTATLQLDTPGPALCALTVLDTAAKWVEPAPQPKDVLIKGLKRLIDSHRNLTEYDAAGECFLTMDNPKVPASSIELTASWLAAAGVRVVGGDMSRVTQCHYPAPATLLAEEATVPRSDFSEAWLWRLVTVGGNGSALASARAPDSITRFEASALCVARNGVAVSSPAVLQVFREFFIHADSPRRLRRGDSAIIRYRLFNYLYEPLSVQIQILTDPHLEGPLDFVETACISARSSIARRSEVRARLPGNARVSVRAKSVRDGRCNVTAAGSSGVSDEVLILINVDPEGVPVQEHRSIQLCARGSTESSTSDVLWSWPSIQSVAGTEALTVWATGDITGPMLADADSLVSLPRGCGEQNMARLASNLLALQQLNPKSAAATTAREHVARGFTRQLQYVHPAGGFSAFGASDATPSTWLTAFSLRYLRKVHQVLSPGLPTPPALERAERWLLNQQMENGCFRNEGQVFHREFKGGLNEEGEVASVALTAYVITSLVESSTPSHPISSRVLRNSLSCLRAIPLKVKTPSRVYAHAILAYTFMRLKRYEEEVKRSNEAMLWEKKTAGLEREEEMKELVELMGMARRNEDFVWWETSSLSTSIEATSYAALSLWECSLSAHNSACAEDGRAALRWLNTHRSAAGGFVSTQDTLVALEALSTWSSSQSPSTNLTVTARSSGTVKTITLQASTVPDIMKMPVGNQLSVTVEGSGCALVQATRSYHTMSSDSDQNKKLLVQVSVHTDGPFDCDDNGTCFCAARIETCVVWSGNFPEMALLEVSLPGGFGADASLLYSQLRPSNMLLRRIELTPNGSKATLYLGTRDGSDTMGRGGHQCYSIHAVGPKAKTKPAYTRVMDYYRPSVNDTQMYTIPEDCPSRITHEANDYRSSDNLFNKARSLNSGEIIINHEFSFEDIPDGIPLEDPMYDNLTENDKADLSQPIEDAKVKIDDKNDFGLEKTVENDEPIEVEDSRAKEDSSSMNTAEIDKENREDIVVHKSDVNLPIIDSISADTNTNIANIEIEHNQAKKFNKEQINNSDPIIENKTDDIKEKIQKKNDTENEIPKLENYKHRIEIRDSEHENAVDSEVTDRNVENPNLSSFHVIDSEKDLDVPPGVEGPVPSVVLPPQNFVMPPADMTPIIPVYENPRRFQYQGYSTPDFYYFQPYNNPYFRTFRNRVHSPFG